MSHLEYLMHLKHVVQSWQMVALGRKSSPFSSFAQRKSTDSSEMEKGPKNVYLVLFLVFSKKKQILKSIISKLQFNPRDSSSVMKEEKGEAGSPQEEGDGQVQRCSGQAGRPSKSAWALKARE